MVASARGDRTGLTFAGVGVASLSRSPGQIVVEVLTLLTVQAFSVVVTHAVTMNLQTQPINTRDASANIQPTHPQD